jgi:hypothetical protein
MNPQKKDATYLLIPKARPSVVSGFLEKVVPRAIDGCRKEELARVAIVEFHGRAPVHLGQKGRVLFPVTSVLGVVSVCEWCMSQPAKGKQHNVSHTQTQWLGRTNDKGRTPC